MNCLRAVVLLMRRPAPWAQESKLSAEPRPRTDAELLNEIASILGFEVEALKSKSRQRPLVTGRQIAMYVFREQTDLSYPSIARLSKSCAQQGYKPQYMGISQAIIDSNSKEPTQEGLMALDKRRLNDLRLGFSHLRNTVDLEREYLQEMLDRGNAHEAKAWLAESLNRTFDSIGRGDAVLIVDELYQAGAVKVTAMVYGPECGQLIVELPSDKDKRKKIFAWEAKFQKKQGDPPTKDEGQDSLMLGV